MKLTRREALALAAAMPLARAAAADDPLAGASLYRDVLAYFEKGEHRTSSPGDVKTSEWLHKQLAAAGFQPAFQSFALRQFFVKECHVQAGTKRIRAFPLWYPRAAGVAPLREGVVVVNFPFDPRAVVAKGHTEIIQKAVQAGAKGIVGVTQGPTGEIIALNTDSEEPWLVPVVLVAARDASALNGNLEMVLHGDDNHRAEARNVAGRLRRGKQWIVVSTPISGWFGCAGERGPGIALFLGLARWAAQRKNGPSLLFVGTSGHELEGRGMRTFLRDQAPKPEEVLFWLHLGAGIATWDWEGDWQQPGGYRKLNRVDTRRYLMTSADLESVIKEPFSTLPGLRPVVGQAVGEFAQMLQRGYRTFAIAAGHRFHHTPVDTPDKTAAELLEPVGRAVKQAWTAIEAAGEPEKRMPRLSDEQF